MVKVTLHDETPSEALVAAAQGAVEFTDPQGRRISLRDPGVIAQFRIIKALGAELAANTSYVLMVMPLLYVAAIDADAITFPRTDDEVEALIVRLGTQGVAAVMAEVQKNFSAADPEAAAKAVK